jgi:6-pyruvoyltetrahydropterin/6-carboxytetrahydropterin synthase
MNIYELSQSFMFDAAHTLTRTVPLDEFKASRRIHGHTYTACVTIRGTKGPDGMLQFSLPKMRKPQSVDLFYLRRALEDVRSHLDHHFLDEVEGLGPATMENLCDFIYDRLKAKFPVVRVTVSRANGDVCNLIVGAAS